MNNLKLQTTIITTPQKFFNIIHTNFPYFLF